MGSNLKEFFKKHLRNISQKPVSDLWILDVDKCGVAYMLK